VRLLNHAFPTISNLASHFLNEKDAQKKCWWVIDYSCLANREIVFYTSRYQKYVGTDFAMGFKIVKNNLICSKK
jgi:hypothetical protein